VTVFLSTCLPSDTIDVCVDDGDCLGEGNTWVPSGCARARTRSPTAWVLGRSCASGLAFRDAVERACLE
jgi:hypothetical protein